ncbi:MAG: tetratricopeptide repeat protein [Myxococcota bacterium]
MADEIMIEGIIPVAQKDVRLLLEAGYLYMELSKWTEAEEVFRGVAALVPHSEVPHMALGHLYFSRGRFSPALKAHKKAIELKPESAAAHASVGETLMFLHKHKEAVAELDKARALEPDGPAGQFAQSLKEAFELGVFG